MKPPLHQQIWTGIKFYMRICVFLLHVGFLVPGIVFWAIFLLLRGDMTALALASDNLISRYLAANLSAQQNFLGLCGVGAGILFFFILSFRWRHFWRELKQEKVGGQHND